MAGSPAEGIAREVGRSSETASPIEMPPPLLSQAASQSQSAKEDDQEMEKSRLENRPQPFLGAVPGLADEHYIGMLD